MHDTRGIRPQAAEVARRRRFALIGDPGAGKSTLTKRAAALRRRPAHRRQRVRLERPLVLLVAGTLDATRGLIALMERAVEASRSLVVVAEDFSADVSSLLVVNASLQTIRLCAVRAPGVGERRRALLDDLALTVGSRPLDLQAGDKLGALTLSQLGCVERFESGPRQTVFVGGRGDARALETHLGHLRRRALQADDVREREGLQERVAMLASAVAVIRIGAATELEYHEKVDRTDDALRTARAALREGAVPGGGVAYLRARTAAADAVVSDPGAAAGVATLVTALEAPFLQILTNAGIEALPVLARVERRGDWEGFDVATGCCGNLQAMGVVDAAAVVRSALRNAVSADDRGLMKTGAGQRGRPVFDAGEPRPMAVAAEPMRG